MRSSLEQLLGDAPAVEPRHHHVEDDHVGPPVRASVDAASARPAPRSRRFRPPRGSRGTAAGSAARRRSPGRGSSLNPARLSGRAPDVDWNHGREGASGFAPRLLRRGRAGSRDGRTALELYGPPVYVRKQIVHNLARRPRPRGARRGLRRGRERGARGRDDRLLGPRRRPAMCTSRRPSGSLQTIDATCPLVTKVHVQARRYAAAGYTVILIGHAGHEEVVGTMGEAPDSIVLVESTADVDELSFPESAKLAYVTQTTLSVDETGEIDRGSAPAVPARSTRRRSEDICYATSNRQWAVKEMLDRDRPAARDRLAQLVELEPARRDRPRRRRRRAPDRRRVGDRRAAGSTACGSSG